MSYTLKLKNRGTSVISGIDLFDECHYGADKLFLRGNFCCPKCVGQQIKIALGDDELLDEDKLTEIYYGVTIDDTFKKTKLGIGNPLEQELLLSIVSIFLIRSFGIILLLVVSLTLIRLLLP